MIKYLLFLLILPLMIIPTAFASNSEHVVINEVDINPPGDDSVTISEWVELYNPTNYDIDISGWEIASTTVLKKTMIISNGTTIQARESLTYSYQTVWFTDLFESVELRDANGNVIDKTPPLTDITNDFKSWQRIYDGYDNDSPRDWKFVPPTPGSSNGKQMEHLILKQKQLITINYEITHFEKKINNIQSTIDSQQIRLDKATLDNATQRIDKLTANIEGMTALQNIYESLIILTQNQIKLYQ